MFYDRPPGGSKTRVTSRPFILATSPNQTYLPPSSWPARSLPPDATAGLVSPILIDQPAAQARKITIDRLDLTNLTQPAHNPVATVSSMQSFTINENPTNTIKLNGKTYRQNSTYFLRPGAHAVRNASGTQTGDAEYIIVFTEERDWTDKIALSVLLKSVPVATNPASGSQTYFSAIQTTQTTEKGVPLSDLLADLRGTGAYTYHGSTFIPTSTTGAVEPMTWYVFEQPVTIATTDLERIWAVADASGNLFAGVPTPATATVVNTFYMPASQILYARGSTAGASQQNATLQARECKIVQTRQYYDSKTGTLQTIQEGDRFVPVNAIVKPPTTDSTWLMGDTAATETARAGAQPAIEPRTIETIVAVLVGLLVAISIVLYFASRQGLLGGFSWPTSHLKPLLQINGSS